MRAMIVRSLTSASLVALLVALFPKIGSAVPAPIVIDDVSPVALSIHTK